MIKLCSTFFVHSGFLKVFYYVLYQITIWVGIKPLCSFCMCSISSNKFLIDRKRVFWNCIFGSNYSFLQKNHNIYYLLSAYMLGFVFTILFMLFLLILYNKCLGKFLLKGPGRKYYRLCRTYDLCCILNFAILTQKPLYTIWK